MAAGLWSCMCSIWTCAFTSVLVVKEEAEARDDFECGVVHEHPS